VGTGSVACVVSAGFVAFVVWGMASVGCAGCIVHPVVNTIPIASSTDTVIRIKLGIFLMVFILLWILGLHRKNIDNAISFL
jgi:hypothetical protein